MPIPKAEILFVISTTLCVNGAESIEARRIGSPQYPGTGTRALPQSDSKWIERILRQCRTTLTGVGLKEFKDIADQVRNLPKLTGQASYPAWRIAVDKLISASKDGRQLIHLEKVLAFIELSVPLGPLFDRLPRAEFDEATATRELNLSRSPCCGTVRPTRQRSSTRLPSTTSTTRRRDRTVRPVRLT